MPLWPLPGQAARHPGSHCLPSRLLSASLACTASPAVSRPGCRSLPASPPWLLPGHTAPIGRRVAKHFHQRLQEECLHFLVKITCGKCHLFPGDGNNQNGHLPAALWEHGDNLLNYSVSKVGHLYIAQQNKIKC